MATGSACLKTATNQKYQSEIYSLSNIVALSLSASCEKFVSLQLGNSTLVLFKLAFELVQTASLLLSHLEAVKVVEGTRRGSHRLFLADASECGLKGMKGIKDTALSGGRHGVCIQTGRPRLGTDNRHESVLVSNAPLGRQLL